MTESDFTIILRHMHHNRKDVDVPGTLVNLMGSQYVNEKTRIFIANRTENVRAFLEHNSVDQLIHFYRAFMPLEIKDLDRDAFEALLNLSAVIKNQ